MGSTSFVLLLLYYAGLYTLCVAWDTPGKLGKTAHTSVHIATDLDVEAVKPFPNEWTGPETALATCDVVLGVEHDCFDDECVSWFSRKGQIQNWSMWTRRRHSPFLSELIEYVVAKYKTFPPHDKKVSVQDVFGSGSITDFVRLYGDIVNSTHYEVPTTESGGTLQTDHSSILRIHKHHE
ncbi:hypothetical protein As57867_007564, partial [Aphanomyces stellatus]